MKKTKRCAVLIAPLLVVAAALILILSAGDREKLVDRISTAPALTGQVYPDGDAALLEKNGMKLFLEENMVVRVEDGRGGVWSTNGVSAAGKQTVDQLKLSYYTANAAYSYMESQSDSVDMQQADAFVQDGILYVEYRLGDYDRTLDDVPAFLTGKRFQALFLDKLTPEDADVIQTYYKYYDDEDAWRIKSKGRNNYKTILKYMDEVGYTPEDLALDNADGGISTETTVKPKFKIVLAYELSDDGLIVSMPVERIEFLAAFPLYEVDVLPHFGLVSQNEEGFVLLPDGSGALMRFQNDYNSRSEYSIPVYGLDWAVASDTLSTGQYQYELAALPVFGMKDGASAYLAEISSCAEKATLKYHPAGTYFPRNEVYATFRMINKDSVYLSGSDNSSKVILFETSLADADFKISYHFLENGSGYTEMAALYRSILYEAGVLRELDSGAGASVLIETVGAVLSKKNKLGVSYEGLTAATAYDANRQIAEELMAGGVGSVDMRLIGWFNGGVYHAYPGRLKLDSVLGGKEKWLDLLDWAQEAGVGIYPDVDFQRFPEGSGGFRPARDSAFRLDGHEAMYSILSRALLLEKYDIGLTPSSLYLLSPARFRRETEAFIKSYAGLSSGALSLRSTRVYSDFNKKGMTSRTNALSMLRRQLEMLSGEYELMADSACLYCFPYASVLCGVPVDSSHYRIADETVPFMQLVLHGAVKMYTSSLNLTSDSARTALRAIEYGVLPCYQVTYEASSVLKNSEYQDNYASGFGTWRDEIIACASASGQALDGLVGMKMTGHRMVTDNVYATTYENGVTVYVNYNAYDVKAGDIVIGACSFNRTNGD
ncbi:MAG: hypothetical protein IKR85_05490 [Clostridia bacterium]|nr:hypothetical protein [Clostridia bacterium]